MKKATLIIVTFLFSNEIIVFLCYDNALFSATLNIQIIYVNYVLLKVIFVKDVSSQFPLTEDNIYLCLQKYINQTNINVR